ncbi:hypothetical protein QBC39DRAFT_331057 [Podospora conica]|nr:hypothetical protein QBC39DRAFT_331057 [Schizothecium conicum]
MTSILRDAKSLPEYAWVAKTITFRHPDYPIGENALLCLGAIDNGGIDYDTALNGFFATRQFGHQALTPKALTPIVRPPDSILRLEEYYFQLPDEETPCRPYPIVATFKDWTFPHDALPMPWSEAWWQQNLNPPQAPSMRCRIMDVNENVHSAHIVPLACRDWFDRENLGQYIPIVPDQQAFDSPSNMIHLQSLILDAFERQSFFIVPKQDRVARLNTDLSQAPPPSLVVHVVDHTSDQRFREYFHNRKLHPADCKLHCLFARFAWVIFGVPLQPFWTGCRKGRVVFVRDDTTGAWSVTRQGPFPSINLGSSPL